MGWGFPIFYSTKNKVFTSDEQQTIDKVCRSLNKLTKKKFSTEFFIETNEKYGEYNQDGEYENDILVQTMNYIFNFENHGFEMKVSKLWGTNKSQCTKLLYFSEDWDYAPKHEFFISNLNKMPNNFKLKDINGIKIMARTFKNSKENMTQSNYYGDDNSHILLSYNSKWKTQLNDKINEIFKAILINI